MASAKEKCFQKALEDYQEATDKDMGVRWQQVWTQSSQTGRWAMSERDFFTEVFSQVKTRLFQLGRRVAPGLTRQVRVPDITLTPPITAVTETGPMVIDLKFTRPSGGVDDWTSATGKGNNRTQLEDYNEINQQNDPGTDVSDPKLDPSTCNCGEGEGQRAAEPIRVPMTAEQWQQQQQFFVLPLLGPAPGLIPGPAPAPQPFPVLRPLPIP